MLGRTHMAIGAVGAVLTAPMLLHADWLPILSIAHTHHFTGLGEEGEFVLAAVVGSIVPDLEQKDSLLARRVERIGQFLVFAVVVGLVFTLHLETSLYAWGAATVLALGLISRAQIMMQISLGVLGAGFLALGATGHINMTSASLFAVWCVVTMFARHRTWTHGIAGLGVFVAGAMLLVQHSSLAFLASAVGVGYALHMIADGISGGVPLLWPIVRKRQGIRIVQTGSVGDHLIGLVGTVAFLALAILW